MGKEAKSNIQKHSTVVQTARMSTHPFSVIERHRALSRPEFAVFDAIREAVPVVSAAIDKLIRLVGNFTIECDNKKAEKELAEFLKTVPTGVCTCGINSFLGIYLDSLLMYGTAVGEYILNEQRSVVALYNAPLKNIEIAQSENPFKYVVSVRESNGNLSAVRHPERLLITGANPTTDYPFGRSLLDGLPFVTSVLLKIYNSVGTNFERIGNLRYAVTYKPSESNDTAFGQDRATEIAREWSAAMSDKEGVRDFVAVGDVDIKVIGADNQILDTEVPAKQMLEQIIAKTGLPPFILGLSWSTTERMSKQQADILTSELEYYRELLNPVISKICRSWLYGEGYYCDFNVIWNDVTLQDEVEQARARLYRAQSAVLEKEGGGVQQ